MQAVEQGLVELDEPVGRLVPELAEPKVVVDSTATTMELRNAEWVEAMHPKTRAGS